MENMIGEICIPNISTAERRRRLASGALALLAGLIALAGLVVLEFNLWWRLALFPCSQAPRRVISNGAI